MRNLMIGLTIFLAACNSSSSSGISQEQLDAAIAKVQASIPPSQATQMQALQAKLHELRLVGNSRGIASAERTLAIGEAAVVAPNFGPCTNMGVLIGFTNSNGTPANALTATGRIFSQCTGYQYESEVSNGAIGVAERIFWDGQNCTGNEITWESAGSGYSTDTLQNGVVFSSPIDGSILMVTAGQTPQPILIQSAWVKENPGCQSDIETQLMYIVTKNDVTISGVPDSGTGKFQLNSP